MKEHDSLLTIMPFIPRDATVFSTMTISHLSVTPIAILVACMGSVEVTVSN